MKKQYGKMVVPVMLGVLCAAPAFAQEEPPTPPEGFYKFYAEEVAVSLTDTVSTELTRTNSNNTSFSIEGSATVEGTVEIENAISALIDNKQVNHDNSVCNFLHTNTADAGDGVLSDATGNIGLNIAAGDNNVQDNAAAIAAADADFVFDAADATVVVNQDTLNNWISNHGTTNSASLGGDSLSNASGNIGVNIAAGDSNLQKNNFAATAAASGIATAAVSTMQQVGNNHVSNSGHYDLLWDVKTITLTGGVSQNGSQASISGTYSGQADQLGNLYLDTWDSPLHPAGAQDHHIDLDSYVQALLPDPNNPYVDDPATSTALTPADIDPNGDGGSLLLNEDGIISASMSNLALSGSFSGTVWDAKWVAAPTSNTASLGDNALAGAAGNIGVNIAAGTNNLQSNSLAMIAHFTAPADPGGGGEL